MSSFLCFICHSTVNSDTNEETRDKYREVVGMNLCPDSHLCYICCHVLNKLSLFRSVCLKRSLEYPVLFSEKGTLNLQKTDIENHILCPEETCQDYDNRKYQYDIYPNYNNYNEVNQYELQDNEFNDSYNAINHYSNVNNDYYTNNDSVINNDPNAQIQMEDDNYNDDISDENHHDMDDTNHNCDIDDNMKSDEVIKQEDEVQTEIDIQKNKETANDSKETDLPQKKKKVKKKGFLKTILNLEEQKAELEARRKEKKYIEAEFKCFNCAMSFLFKDTYQAHMMRHEESNGEYRCVTCSLRFASSGVLRAHTSLHTERYNCLQCNVTLRPRSRRGHECGYEGKRDVACHLCGYLFKDSSGLQQHLKRAHRKNTGRLHTCNVCGERFANQAAVRTHMIKHIKKKFTCDQCSATYSSPYTLTQHKKKHFSVPVTHYCETCHIGFLSRKSLLAHLRNTAAHQQTVFECPICTRVCPHQKSLSLHMQRVHSSEAQFGCGRCGARYSSAKSLREHARGHSVVTRAPAVCHLCGTSYKSNSKLNRHLREVCEKAKLDEQLSSMYE